MQKILIFFSLSCVMLLGCQSTPDPATSTSKQKKLYIVTHKDNPVTTITKKELEKIYFGKQHRWEDSSLLIYRYDYPPIYQPFYEQILDTPLLEVNRYWNKEKIMGGKTPPITIKRLRDLFPRLQKDLGGIGYIPTKEIPKYVKIIAEFDIVQ